ncbi:MAG: MATE family efflux transporter [Pseudomonadota bacterium]
MRSGGFHTGPPGEAVRPDPPPQPRSLIEGPIAPALISFSLPLLTTNLLHAVAGTWTAIWVSHVLGPGALIAVVNANVFVFMMIGTFMGVGMASGIAIGQSFGADDEASVKRVVGASVGFALTTGIAIGAVGLVFTPFIVDLVRIPPEARSYAITFVRITCLALPTLFVFIFMMMMMRGLGDARTPFRFTVLWIGLGLVLSPLLLTGWGPFPRLGIAGAALAGLIANATALAGMIVYLYRNDMPLALRGPELRYLRPDRDLLIMLVQRGAPMGAETIIVQGAYFVLLSMVNAHGAETAAAYGGAAQLWGYVQMPAIALSASMSAMAAQNIGANRWDRIDAIALRGCLIGFAVTVGAALILYALGDLPLRLFLPQGGPSLEIAREINLIVLWSWSMLAITAGLSAMVRANGAMIPPTVVFFITMWLFRVPFASALQPMFGVSAIWWSFPVGTTTSAALAYAYYRWGRWRRNALLMSGSGGG